MGAHDELPARGANPQSNQDIELEPISVAMDEAAAPGDSPTDTDAPYAIGSVDQESTRLLRSRLLFVAGYFLVCHIVFALFEAISPGSVLHAIATSVALRAAAAALVFGVLWSPFLLTRPQLRAVECFLFGAEMLIILGAQYAFNREFIDQGDALGAVAYQKDGVLRVVACMVAFGVFVPHAPRITARVVLTMAISLIVCHGVVLQHALNAHALVDRLAGRQNAIANALFLLMGASLAIVAAYILRGLGRERSEARRLGEPCS